MKIENKTAPIPIRMDKQLRQRVALAASKLGTARSSIIRMGILIILKQVDAGFINLNSDGTEQSKDPHSLKTAPSAVLSANSKSAPQCTFTTR